VTVALATAMVMVNTVVIVQGMFDLQRDASALAFFVFGAGAILGAVLLPLALGLVSEHRLMLTGAAAVTAGLAIGTVQSTLVGLLVLWALIGLGIAWTLTPVTYLIRRIASPADMQTLFAAQMSIANGCLLVAYPLAGWLGATLGMSATFAILAALAGCSATAAWRLWRG
jgi:MFS family permease